MIDQELLDAITQIEDILSKLKDHEEAEPAEPDSAKPVDSSAAVPPEAKHAAIMVLLKGKAGK